MTVPGPHIAPLGPPEPPEPQSQPDLPFGPSQADLFYLWGAMQDLFRMHLEILEAVQALGRCLEQALVPLDRDRRAQEAQKAQESYLETLREYARADGYPARRVRARPDRSRPRATTREPSPEERADQEKVRRSLEHQLKRALEVSERLAAEN